MTETTTATRSTFSVTIGRTDAEFETHWDRDWTDDGCPIHLEWQALPYEAEVAELRHSEGTAATYGEAAALARLVIATAPAGAVVQYNLSDGTGMTFRCGIWETVDSALGDLDEILAWA